MSGLPLKQAGVAEHHAQAGEVVLTPAAWALVQAYCTGQPSGIGIPPIADMDAHQTIVAAALAAAEQR